ncbi:MAG TPA: histidinol dehydrogenase [Sphingobacteriaceae bacterium]|nr:histidinol dehydrogenase [Sphingobacteriaceae bacterium]
MLKSYDFSQLNDQELETLLIRNSDSGKEIRTVVEEVIQTVINNGDQALVDYALKFDQVSLDRLYIDEDEINTLANSIDRTEKRALEIAFNNIHKFHQTQAGREKKVETTEGVYCWREARPIEKVGLYIPGGTAVLPSTFLMLGIPARIAGCREIVICTPPQKNGKINGYIAYCAQLLKIDRIYLVGGAQAIAAMAYGTQSIPKVDKVFGPGNQYVTLAKTIIQNNTQTAIDLPAGPSEVLIIGDKTSNPKFIAADLLAQAEHGIDSQAILASTDRQLIESTNQELSKQLSVLPRKEIAEKALMNSYAVYCETLEEAFSFSNQYAPEHLIVALDDAESLTRRIVNAGSVFLGHLTPESLGDYASGTNHTLPTSGYARAYSGVSLDSFIKKITFQEANKTGLSNLGPTVEVLAEIEGLQAHKNAVSIRLSSQTDDWEKN